MAGVSAAQRRITVRGVRLAVEEAGKGPVLLYAHGMTWSRQQDDEGGYWDWSIPARTCRLVRYDARGHGSSEATLDPCGYRWPELALDMLGLADALGVDRFTAGGASMGCATALYAALAAPERISGLALAMPPTAWEARALTQKWYGQIAAMVEAQGLTRAVEAIRREPETGFWAREDPGNSERYLRHLARMDAPVVAAIFGGALQSDLPPVERLASLAMPALILALADDPGHPLGTAEVLVAHLPNAELVVADDMTELSKWPHRIARFMAERSE